MKNPISRTELLALSKKKETEKRQEINRINHIVEKVYDMVLSIAKYNYTTSYMYTVGFISQEDLINVIKELKRLFPKCVITTHQSPEGEAADSVSFSEKTSIRVDWT
jgi:hypothetical protein